MRVSSQRIKMLQMCTWGDILLTISLYKARGKTKKTAIHATTILRIESSAKPAFASLAPIPLITAVIFVDMMIMYATSAPYAYKKVKRKYV